MDTNSAVKRRALVRERAFQRLVVKKTGCFRHGLSFVSLRVHSWFKRMSPTWDVRAGSFSRPNLCMKKGWPGPDFVASKAAKNRNRLSVKANEALARCYWQARNMLINRTYTFSLRGHALGPIWRVGCEITHEYIHAFGKGRWLFPCRVARVAFSVGNQTSQSVRHHFARVGFRWLQPGPAAGQPIGRGISGRHAVGRV
jgi:hypothetical protein